MGVSIAKFNTSTKANTGIEVELLDLATGEGSGAFISVHGTDSKAFKTVVAEISRARVGLPPETDDEREKTNVDVVAACVVGWRGLDNEDGEVLEFSPAAAKALLTDCPAIYEQLNQAIGKRTAFIKA